MQTNNMLLKFSILSLLFVLLALACGQSTPTPRPGAPTALGEVVITLSASLTAVPESPAPLQNLSTPLPETPRIEIPTLRYEAPIPPGDHLRMLNFGALERSYLLHIPPNYDHGRPTSLVLAYHGISLDAQEMARISALSRLADQQNFIVVYPNGTGTHQSWNGGDCCGEARVRQVDDVGFTRALIAELASFLNIDRQRVYATGFSNGAILVYRLACDLADQIAAIGPVSAAPALQACHPSRPVSVIHFHGDADQLNPYAGGKASSSALVFMSVEAGIALWVDLNSCPAQAAETLNGQVLHRLYAPCRDGTTVELYKILGGEHAWPGGEAVSPQVGEPTQAIDASALMWAFFVAHPLP